MIKQDKFIAGFLIFQAIAGTAVAVWLAVTAGPSLGVLLALGPASLAALIAGLGSLRGLGWARTLGIVVFSIQIPSFQTPWFFYAVWLGGHLNITVEWTNTGELGINLLALGMLLWALRRRAPNRSFKPDPLRGSA
ncbi:MAG: hypothetical protein KY442_05920 [Proteobacteria bacterium]|nr:hypothetical protein [Pseudomonadota bacterium]